MRTSKRKVWLKLGLLIAMVFTVVACSGNKEGSTTGSNEPGTSSEGVGAPVELRIFRVAVTQDPTKDRVLLELQKRTNTKLEFITTPWDQYVTKSNTMLASKEKVDIIALEDSQLNYPKLARSGILTPLDDLLNSSKYPNLKAIATDPLFKKYLIDGKIYGIPQLTQPSAGWIAGIRTDWLKNVGLPMPRTPEDLYNVFKAFKEDDPDQNGLDDTLAMYVTPFDPWGFLMTAFVQPVAFKEENGSIVYTATSPEYKKALQFIKRLYDDGLINKDFITIKDKDISINQFIAGKTGIAYSPMWSKTLEATLQNSPQATIELLFPIPHDPASTNGATANDSQWNWMVNVMPSTSKNVEKSLEFLEFMTTDEARKLMSVGIEGIHYDFYKDGVFYGIKAEEQNKDWDPANGEGPTGHPLWWGMINTINGTIDYQGNTGNLMKALQETTTFVSEEDKKSNPYYEQRKLITTVMAHEAVPVILESRSKYAGKLASVRDEYSAKIILGAQADFDKNWDEYVKRMYDSGATEVVAEATEWYINKK